MVTTVLDSRNKLVNIPPTHTHTKKKKRKKSLPFKELTSKGIEKITKITKSFISRQEKNKSTAEDMEYWGGGQI